MESLVSGPVHCAWWPYRPGDRAEARVRDWLGAAWDMPPAALRIERDVHGRPHVDAGPHHADVNWSHSGERLIAACAEGARVGIDIELLRPRPKALALAQRFFHPAETAALETLAADPAALQHAFTRLWCAKEALLKAHGRGLSFGLHRLHVVLDDRDGTPRLLDCDPELGLPGDWRLQAWAPSPGYLATLAWREERPHTSPPARAREGDSRTA